MTLFLLWVVFEIGAVAMALLMKVCVTGYTTTDIAPAINIPTIWVWVQVPHESLKFPFPFMWIETPILRRLVGKTSHRCHLSFIYLHPVDFTTGSENRVALTSISRGVRVPGIKRPESTALLRGLLALIDGHRFHIRLMATVASTTAAVKYCTIHKTLIHAQAY